MNVISTNCAGSYVMTHSNQPLGNPFSWAFTTYSSIKFLLTNYNNVNWMNFELRKNDKVKGTYILNIDKKIDIKYIHYHFNIENKTPKIINHDVSSANIKEFIIQKYIERTNRMLSSNEEPKFLILQNNSSGETKEFIDLYNNTPKTKYKICWGVFKSLKISKLKENTIIIDDSELPIITVNKNYKTIINMLSCN